MIKNSAQDKSVARKRKNPFLLPFKTPNLIAHGNVVTPLLPNSKVSRNEQRSTDVNKVMVKSYPNMLTFRHLGLVTSNTWELLWTLLNAWSSWA